MYREDFSHNSLYTFQYQMIQKMEAQNTVNFVSFLQALNNFMAWLFHLISGVWIHVVYDCLHSSVGQLDVVSSVGVGAVTFLRVAEVVSGVRVLHGPTEVVVRHLILKRKGERKPNVNNCSSYLFLMIILTGRKGNPVMQACIHAPQVRASLPENTHQIRPHSSCNCRTTPPVPILCISCRNLW